MNDRAYTLCAAGAAGIAATMALLCVALLLGAHAHWSLGVVGFLLGTWFFNPSLASRDRVKICLWTAGIWIVSGWLAVKLHPLFIDQYYLEAIESLRDGWNPLSDKGLTPHVGQEMRIYHYSKGAWMLQAILAGLGRRIDFAKTLLPFLSILLALGTLALAKVNGLSKPWRYFTALVVALNPIAVNQLGSYYLDGILGNCLLLQLIFSVRYVQTRELSALFLAAAMAALAATTKLNGVVYASVFALGFAIYLWRASGKAKSLLGPAATYFLFVAILGYSPYFSNVLVGNNPFFPLVRFDGQGYSYEKNGQMPDNFMRWGNLRRFAFSLFAETHGNPSTAMMKPPLVIRSSEWKWLSAPDGRIGGFGAFFSAAIVLSLIGIAWLFKGRELPALGLCGLILLSTLSCPQAWWFRFVPQFFAFPLIIAGRLAHFAPQSPRGRLASAILAVLALNLLLLIAGRFV